MTRHKRVRRFRRRYGSYASWSRHARCPVCRQKICDCQFMPVRGAEAGPASAGLPVSAGQDMIKSGKGR